MRREVMENGVFYYEDLVWGNEEMVFFYNVVNHGFSIGYTPDVIIRHYPQVSAVGRKKFGENRLSSDAVSYLRKNHGRLWY